MLIVLGFCISQLFPLQTEISVGHLEDLARSLAASMSHGSRRDELQATLVSSMLSAGQLQPSV